MERSGFSWRIFPVALLLAVISITLPPAEAVADDTWMNETDAAALINAPFRKTLYAGEMFRLAIPKGRAIRLSLGEGSSRAVVLLIPMRDGKRTGPKEVLKDEPLLLLHSVAEADWFALKVFTGVANLDAEVDTVEEFVVDEGQKTTVSIRPFMQTAARFVNLSDFRSTAVYLFQAGQDDISKSSDWDRTVNLEFKGSSMTKTWKTAADRIVIEAVHGKVQVKLGQPFEKPQ